MKFKPLVVKSNGSNQVKHPAWLALKLNKKIQIQKQYPISFTLLWWDIEVKLERSASTSVKGKRSVDSGEAQ